MTDYASDMKLTYSDEFYKIVDEKYFKFPKNYKINLEEILNIKTELINLLKDIKSYYESILKGDIERSKDRLIECKNYAISFFDKLAYVCAIRKLINDKKFLKNTFLKRYEIEIKIIHLSMMDEYRKLMPLIYKTMYKALDLGHDAVDYFVMFKDDIHFEQLNIAMNSKEKRTLLSKFLSIDPLAVKYLIAYNPKSIKYIINNDWVKGEELRRLAVRLDGTSIKYITDKTTDLLKIAVEQTPLAIQFMDIYNDELIIKALEKDGRMIQFLKPSLCNGKYNYYCKIAVEQNEIARFYIAQYDKYGNKKTIKARTSRA